MSDDIKNQLQTYLASAEFFLVCLGENRNVTS